MKILASLYCICNTVTSSPLPTVQLVGTSPERGRNILNDCSQGPECSSAEEVSEGLGWKLLTQGDVAVSPLCSSLALSDPFPEPAQVAQGPCSHHMAQGGCSVHCHLKVPSPQPALVLATFAWVLMHLINQAEENSVFSPGVELKWVSWESDDFQSWCKGGRGGRAPHPGDRQECRDGGRGVSPPSC